MKLVLVIFLLEIFHSLEQLKFFFISWLLAEVFVFKEFYSIRWSKFTFILWCIVKV